jgi:hypothetical protein
MAVGPHALTEHWVTLRVAAPHIAHSGNIMRSVLLWFIGIPIPIIILLWLVTGHA